MNKTFFILVLSVFAVSGCATVGPSGQTGASTPATAYKNNPRKVEKEANEAMKALVLAWTRRDNAQLDRWDPSKLISRDSGSAERHASLDLIEEAIWIENDTVMMRASWRRDANGQTGSGTTRHMANFIFKKGSPMVLTAIEGESPF